MWIFLAKIYTNPYHSDEGLYLCFEGENLPKAFRNPAHSATKEIIAAFTKKQTDKVVLIIAILEEKKTLEEIKE